MLLIYLILMWPHSWSEAKPIQNSNSRLTLGGMLFPPVRFKKQHLLGLRNLTGVRYPEQNREF
jgi:hypothetical protein